MAIVDGSHTAEEVIKRTSDFLRGDLASDIANAEPNVSGMSEHLLKFHGIYAQDHRDVRRERSLAGAPLEHIFMVRVAIPGGSSPPLSGWPLTRSLRTSLTAPFGLRLAKQFSSTGC